MPIQIQLNGDPHALDQPIDIQGFLTSLGLDPRMVAVERNRAVVKRGDYPTTEIRDGDEVEIVAFVGGG